MSLRSRLTLLLAITAIAASAGTVSFTGPSLPVLGDPLKFNIFGVQLSQPTVSNPNFVLMIETNYGAVISGSNIPPFLWDVDNKLYSIADFLINWNGQNYGLILSPHVAGGLPYDSYTQGQLIKSPNQQFDLVKSGDVLPGTPRPLLPVWVAAGGTQVGAGTVTGAQTGDGVATAKYTITAEFSAPAGFLSTGSFSIQASNYVCDNGIIIGTGTFTGSGGGDVPEPATLFLFVPALALFAGRAALQRRRSANT
jgi:hypothetical protein